MHPDTVRVRPERIPVFILIQRDSTSGNTGPADFGVASAKRLDLGKRQTIADPEHDTVCADYLAINRFRARTIQLGMHTKMNLRSPRVAIMTWEKHRRTRGIAAEFGLHLCEFTTPLRGLVRYGRLIPITIKYLISYTAPVVIVQNPSFVLAVVVVALSKFTSRWKVAIDAHNVAIEQLDASNQLLRLMARAVVRHANLTIVSNDALADVVRRHGGKAGVLPDCLPQPDLTQLPEPKQDPASTAVTVISTFAADEPIEEIFGAADTLGSRYRFVFTGRPDRWLKAFSGRIPPNVGFSGFVPNADYWHLLASSDVIVDISTRKHCLVCGAYEALAVGRPIVLTDDPSTRQLFSAIAVFAKPDMRSIASAIADARAQHARISAASASARSAFLEVWSKRANDLTLELGITPNGHGQQSSTPTSSRSIAECE